MPKNATTNEHFCYFFCQKQHKGYILNPVSNLYAFELFFYYRQFFFQKFFTESIPPASQDKPEHSYYYTYFFPTIYRFEWFCSRFDNSKNRFHLLKTRSRHFSLLNHLLIHLRCNTCFLLQPLATNRYRMKDYATIVVYT